MALSFFCTSAWRNETRSKLVGNDQSSLAFVTIERICYKRHSPYYTYIFHFNSNNPKSNNNLFCFRNKIQWNTLVCVTEMNFSRFVVLSNVKYTLYKNEFDFYSCGIYLRRKNLEKNYLLLEYCYLKCMYIYVCIFATLPHIAQVYLFKHILHILCNTVCKSKLFVLSVVLFLSRNSQRTQAEKSELRYYKKGPKNTSTVKNLRTMLLSKTK